MCETADYTGSDYQIIGATLHQLSSHHVQRLLGCEPANASPISRKISFYDLSASFSCQCVKHKSHGLFGGSSSWAGYAGNTQSQRSSAFFANTHGQRPCDLFANGAINIDQISRHIRQLRFQLVRIHNRAANEVTRTTAY